jgi:hypothetical protein
MNVREEARGRAAVVWLREVRQVSNPQRAKTIFEPETSILGVTVSEFAICALCALQLTCTQVDHDSC